jgi:hypothetical protein
MSVLEAPRILFRGSVAWDPITTNNYDNLYDEDADTPVWPSAHDVVTAYRQEAIAAVAGAGSWNPHGTHRSTFFGTSITGVDRGDGVRTDDPCVQSQVVFQGMLVDVEPYGAFTSQLFFDSMLFGVRGGYQVLCPRTSRFVARYINFSRNRANNMIAGIASVMWQTSFAKTDRLVVDPHDSPALQALAAALDDDDVLGLTVRFDTYGTVYFDDPSLSNGAPQTAAAERALQAKLELGGFQPNPARSKLVGSLGLWRRGEPAQEPGERTLVPAGASPLGSAFARLAPDALVLDLSNSVPETDRSFTKADLGDLLVTAVDPSTGDTTDLGTLTYSDYRREAYETGCGIVTLAVPRDAARSAADGELQIRKAADGSVLLAEQPVRFVPVPPNQYVDQGAAATVAFQSYSRGGPVAGQRQVVVYTMDNAGSTITGTTTLSTDENGLVSFPVPSTNPGVVAFVPAADASAPPSQGINPLVHTYAYLRTLSADAYVAGLDPTWENVYRYVLANWNALAPCMDNYLRLDDPAAVLAAAAVLRRLTDPSRFESFMFMPVTRDMTAGQRALLYAFLDAGPPRADSDAREAVARTTSPTRPAAAQLGTATRRPRDFES